MPATPETTSERMRRLSLLLFFIILSGPASAEPWEFSRLRENGGAFLAGFASGYAAHELGHIIVSGSQGVDYEFDGVTIVYPGANMTDRQHLRVATSGFQAQWLVSEAALRYREKRAMSDFGDSFNAGLVGSHLVITAAYLTILKDHEDGDLLGASDATGISTDRLAALAAIPALLDAWRLFGKDVPKWVPALSLGSKAVGLTAIWTY